MNRTRLGAAAAVARHQPRETPPPVLGTDATVPRRLVHKRAVEHVFVTDVRMVDGHPAASAQLPRLHSFYNDTPTPYYDLLLIGEAARQCVEAMAHRLLDVPDDTAFIMHDMTVELLDPAAFRIGAVPTDLVVRGEVPADRQRHPGDGRATHATDGTAGCWVDGRRVARFAGAVTFVSAHGYAQLRGQSAAAAVRLPAPPPEPPGAAHGGDRADTTAGRQRAGRQRADAARAGRRDPENVVIAPPEIDISGRATAWLTLDADHPVFFEHRQDHYPAMALLEACRQTALAAGLATTGRPEHRLLATRCRAHFDAYAELGTDVLCHAEPGSAAPGGGLTVPVRATQAGRPVMAAELTFTTPGTRTSDGAADRTSDGTDGTDGTITRTTSRGRST
jgi:hypothetical protein